MSVLIDTTDSCNIHYGLSIYYALSVRLCVTECCITIMQLFLLVKSTDICLRPECSDPALEHRMLSCFACSHMPAATHQLILKPFIVMGRCVFEQRNWKDTTLWSCPADAWEYVVPPVVCLHMLLSLYFGIKLFFIGIFSVTSPSQ